MVKLVHYYFFFQHILWNTESEDYSAKDYIIHGIMAILRPGSDLAVSNFLQDRATNLSMKEHVFYASYFDNQEI